MIATVLDLGSPLLVVLVMSVILHAVGKARSMQEDRELLAALDSALHLDRQYAHLLLTSWH